MNRQNMSVAMLPCPCCGSLTISELGLYEICEVCGWEDDPVQAAEPDYAGGANRTSLNEAKKKWADRLADANLR